MILKIYPKKISVFIKMIIDFTIHSPKRCGIGKKFYFYYNKQN